MIIKQCENTRQPIPDRIANAPVLTRELEFYYQAFFELNSERQLGFGEGPIPLTSILAYAKHYELDSEEEADLIYFLTEMDSAYLKKRTSGNARPA